MWAILLYLHGAVAWADGRAMYDRAIQLIDERYLRLDDFEPSVAFVRAAEAAESTIPWLIVESDGHGVVLNDATSSVSVSVPFGTADQPGTLDDLPEALQQLETAILGLKGGVETDTELAVELLKGLTNSMDRHTVVMAKQRLEKFNERIKGKLTGIGAKLRAEEGVIRTEEVFPGTPAERGGLMRGDIIHRVDGVSTLGMSIQQTVDRIRGPKGSTVILLARRTNESGENEELELSFVRDRVDIPNVTWKLDSDGVGVIQIDNFSEHTSRLTLKALESFREAQNQGKAFRGIILDLRGNAGGSLIQSAETTDLFVDAGEIVGTAGRDGASVPNLVRSLTAHPAASPAEEPQVPLVVLQDTRSASASEIVAGALANLDRAVILGRTSFGKGTVQKLYTLRGGAERVRLKLTVAEYMLSGGQRVHDKGIDPDLLMRKVVFRGTGAWYPRVEDVDVPVVLEADERDGWQLGQKPDLNVDPLMDVAHQIVVAAAGPSRQDGLDAIGRLATAFQADAQVRLSKTFLHREMDWQPTDETPGILNATVALEVIGEPLAGQRVTVRAELTNQGPAPLYQARVRLLSADRRTPWHNKTIPVGFVPPGERAIGQVEVPVSVDTPDRSDDVVIRLEADELDPVELESVPLNVIGIPAPPLAVTARLQAHEDHHRIEVELHNKGVHNLTGVQLRLGWQDDSGLELLDRAASLPALAAGTTERVDLGVRVLEPETTTEVPVGIRVWAERFQTVLHEPLDVPTDGTEVHVEPPVVKVIAPTRVDDAQATVDIHAQDEGRISSVTVWWQGEKYAWSPGGAESMRQQFELPMTEGSNQLTVVVRDDDNRETRVRRYVWGDRIANGPVTEGSDAN